MVDVMAKMTEFVSKTIEKLSEASNGIKEDVHNLDAPLNDEKCEKLGDNGEAKERVNKLDKPLNDETSEHRFLTEDEKQKLRDDLKWSDKVIDSCTINDKTNHIHYPCRNEGLAGKTHPDTGVEYVKSVQEYNGHKVEVVAPKFDAKFEANLPENLYHEKDKCQFAECNKQLYEAIQKNPELAKSFTPEQLEQIKDGITRGGAPDGYTWHHDVEAGKMQLVDSDIHGDSGHTGGRTLWGGGSDYR